MTEHYFEFTVRGGDGNVARDVPLFVQELFEDRNFRKPPFPLDFPNGPMLGSGARIENCAAQKLDSEVNQKIRLETSGLSPVQALGLVDCLSVFCEESFAEFTSSHGEVDAL